MSESLVSGEPRDLHYDYDFQCWVEFGKVMRCGHLEQMAGCYACGHWGERIAPAPKTEASTISQKEQEEEGRKGGAQTAPDALRDAFESFGFTLEATGGNCSSYLHTDGVMVVCETDAVAPTSMDDRIAVWSNYEVCPHLVMTTTVREYFGLLSPTPKTEA